MKIDADPAVTDDAHVQSKRQPWCNRDPTDASHGASRGMWVITALSNPLIKPCV